MAMVLDELVTNATKYRALSNSPGRVSVAWRWQWKGCRHGKLLLEWQEIGGPPITPNVSGYGTSVIPDLIPYELGGTVDYRLAPACPAPSSRGRTDRCRAAGRRGSARRLIAPDGMISRFYRYADVRLVLA